MTSVLTALRHHVRFQVRRWRIWTMTTAQLREEAAGAMNACLILRSELAEREATIRELHAERAEAAQRAWDQDRVILDLQHAADVSAAVARDADRHSAVAEQLRAQQHSVALSAETELALTRARLERVETELARARQQLFRQQDWIAEGGAR